MREGGCLGFECKHLYAIRALAEKELLSHVLKGADYNHGIFCSQITGFRGHSQTSHRRRRLSVFASKVF